MKDINIKQLNSQELDNLAQEIRSEIIDACSKNGGHLGSSLGIVEATIALHKAFDFPKDKLIFDVGHQSYAHKILSGRNLDSLRKFNGVSGFQKMSESEYDPYDAGHSSTSISAAMGIACSRDLKGENFNVIAFVGDASISNGVSFEALNQIADFNHKIIIILNDNNMSISSTNGSLHKAFNGVNSNIFEELGFKFIGPVDGYDFNAMEKAFNEAKDNDKSVIINVSTIKGKGYKYSEMDDDGFWHGVGPFDVKTGLPKNPTPDGFSTFSKIYARGLAKIMKEDESAILITPATFLGSNLRSIMKEYPSRAFDVGISEEHAVILANALALQGHHPYVSIYSTFLQRAFDEILHDNARHNTSVTYLVDRAGLVGEDGETHQGIYDVAMLNAIPNTTIIEARDEEDALNILAFARTFNHPLFIRFPKGLVPSTNIDLPSKSTITYGKWEIVKKASNDVCLITLGESVNEFLDQDITLINARFLNPVDKDMLSTLLNYKRIVIYDPTSIYNGFGRCVEDELYKLGYKNQLIVKALPNSFIPQGTVQELLESLNLSTDNIKDLLK